QPTPSGLENIYPPSPTTTKTPPCVSPFNMQMPPQSAAPACQAAPASLGTTEIEGLSDPPGPPLTLPLIMKEYVVPLASPEMTAGDDAPMIALLPGMVVQLSSEITSVAA